MKKTTIILMFLSMLTMQQLMAGEPELIASKTTICYEETVTLGDLVNLNSSFGLKMEVKLGNGAYTTLLSYTGYAFPALTSEINLKKNPDIANMAFGSENSITIRISGDYNTTIGTSYDEIKKYTLSRGFDPSFDLPLKMELTQNSESPQNTGLDLTFYTNRSQLMDQEKFTSSTATIQQGSMWNFNDVTGSKNKWAPFQHTIYFHPAKYNGCGIDSVGETTKIIPGFVLNYLNINNYICNNSDTFNLLSCIKKPLPIDLGNNLKYTCKFTSSDAPNAIRGNYFDPKDLSGSVYFVYHFFQQDANNRTIQSDSIYFRMYVNIAPEYPEQLQDDSLYCTGDLVEIKLSNFTNQHIRWTNENVISDSIHPYIIKNIKNDNILTVEYLNNFCSSKTDIHIPIDKVQADFTISEYTPTTDQLVQFNANSDDAITFTWNFGDGTYGFIQDAEHIFNNEGTYDISLTVKSDNGCEVKQTKKSAVVVSDGTGINSKNAETLNIWPQPVGNELNFSIPGNASATCTITDLSGKTVFSKTVTDQTNTIDVSMLNQGMFILTIKTSDNVYVNQFIKK